ncbi:MAG: hypothetical protein WCH11_04190 [Bdellovibrio sp.]
MKSAYAKLYSKAAGRASGKTLGAKASGSVPSNDLEDLLSGAQAQDRMTLRQATAGKRKSPEGQWKRRVFSDDSDPVENLLRARLQPQNSPRSKRKSLSWKWVSASIVGFLCMGLGLSKLEEIEKFLTRIELQALSRASANSGANSKAAPESAQGSSSTEASASPAPGSSTSSRELKPEDIDHFRKLNERKKQLDAREEELLRMEQELAAQKEELQKRLESLEQTRNSITQILKDRVKVDEAKVETLVQMYSNMKPQQAAAVFEKMDEDLAVEVLGRMKKKNAAEIMNIIKSEKAQILTEKFAGYGRRQPAQHTKKEGGM